MRFEIGRDAKRPRVMMRTFWRGPREGLIRIQPEALRRWEAGEVEAFWRCLLHEVAHLQTPGKHHTKPWKIRAAALGASRHWGTVAVRFPETE